MYLLTSRVCLSQAMCMYVCTCDWLFYECFFIDFKRSISKEDKQAHKKKQRKQIFIVYENIVFCDVLTTKCLLRI